MKFEKKSFTVEQLVKAWASHALSRNAEYQRGGTWTLPQKQCLIDSLFRQYPIPALFLHEVTAEGGLGGQNQVHHEVVDGQQRLLALSGYLTDSWPLLKTEDKALRVPMSVRRNPAPWAGRKFSELTPEQKTALRATPIDVYLITAVDNADEIRDLFIRLQSGTALTRQQIRDAWPGLVGPFIEGVAGKIDRVPGTKLFDRIDQRGQNTEEDDRDEYVGDRMFCAQLLRIFLAREANPTSFPGIRPDDLDALYHEETNFDPDGPTARRFREALDRADSVLERARDVAEQSLGGRKRKFSKGEVFALVLLFQDRSKDSQFVFTKPAFDRLARALVSPNRPEGPKGPFTSGAKISVYYEWWRANVATDVGVKLDPVRQFGDQHKAEIRARDRVCKVCGEAVPSEEEEFDHYPVAHRDGGRTETSNGRLVHQRCHPRGRPPDDRA